MVLRPGAKDPVFGAEAAPALLTTVIMLSSTVAADSTLIFDGGSFGLRVMGGGRFLPAGGFGAGAGAFSVDTELLAERDEAGVGMRGGAGGSAAGGWVAMGILRMTRGWMSARGMGGGGGGRGAVGGSATWSCRPRKLRFLRSGAAIMAGDNNYIARDY